MVSRLVFHVCHVGSCSVSHRGVLWPSGMVHHASGLGVGFSGWCFHFRMMVMMLLGLMPISWASALWLR